MNKIVIEDIMPNIIYKHLLDILNKEPERKIILDKFSSKFDYVWLTLYGDIVVAVEIENEAVFILQEGVFRYKKYIGKKPLSYISLKEYLSKEYFNLSIAMDLYLNQENFLDKTQINFPMYKLETLIGYSKDKSLIILDHSLSEKYLNELYDNLISYYSLVKENNSYIDLVQS